MKKNNFKKFFGSMLAFLMVLSLLSPSLASANTQQTNPFERNEQTEAIMEMKAAIVEQLNVLDGGPTLHKDLQGLSGNEEVAVIVHLSEKPVALEMGIKELAGKTLTSSEAATIRTNIKAQHTLLKKEMTINNISFEEGFSFDTVLNGFSGTVKAKDLEKLLEIKGVILVEPDTEVHAFETPKVDGQVEANMDTSVPFLGINKLWAEGFEGQGIKVAVLDTGIDKYHPEFAGIYKGGKNFIPNGSTYTKKRADDDASETLPSERPAGSPEFSEKGSAFYTSHGTHVAGTIAAIGANQYGIKGIAPKVDLYAYRVLGAYGSGSTSGIVKAIDTAVIEKMDVINLSLGGGANTEADAGSYAINNAMLAGVISVIATGNSGPKRGTMGTPSTAPLGIAVGNTTNPETMHDIKISVEAGSYKFSKQLKLMATTFGESLETKLSGEFEIVEVPGVGKPTDFTGIDIKGKVALIARGEIAFVEKIANAKEKGAVATIIYNSATGSNTPNASGTFLGDDFDFLPTVDMSYTDGIDIRENIKTTGGKITFSDAKSTKTLGDDVNDSSSRGPSTPNFDIKPDVSAPGTNIMSTIPMYKEDKPDADYSKAFGRKTGTSMATPHVAGIAALIKQANPTWNAFNVKVALSNTAKILDTEKYDVMSQGAGRVQPYEAAHASVLAYAIDKATYEDKKDLENLKGTVTFGPQSLEKDLSVTKQIRVKDLKGSTGGDYKVTVEITKAFKDAKLTIDQESFTLNGEQMLNVTLTASKAEVKMGDEFLGYIHITSGTEDISLPFAADFGGAAKAELKDFNITETDLSFDGDGVQDEAVLSFDLTGDLLANYIEIWNIMDPKGGEFKDGYIGHIHATQSLAAGKYSLTVKGQYKPWDKSPATTIPDGLYTINFSGSTVSGNPKTVSDFVGPIVVKTTKPEIAGSVNNGKATGQLTDKYIEYNKALEEYDLVFNLNDKLHASYVISQDGKAGQPESVQLAQDGSFTFPLSTLDVEKDTVTVFVVDEAGNKAEKVIFGDGVDPVDPTVPEQPIVVTPIDKVPSKPIDESNKFVKSFGFDSIAISPNGDKQLDSAGFSFEFKEQPTSSVYVNVLDPAQFTTEPDEWDAIGDVFWDYSKPLAKTGTFDGMFANKNTNKKEKLNDGAYKLELYAFNAKYNTMSATIEPVFVKSTASVITGENATEVDGTEFALEGKVEDKFFEFQPALKEHFGVEEFDINNYLKASYVVQNKEFNTVDEGKFLINADGTYMIQLTNLEKGQKYKVSVIVQDIAGNDAVKAFTVETSASPEAVVTLAVDKADLSIEEGKTATVKVTETTTIEDKATEADVTADATYEVADDSIASVVAGVITAKEVGETTVTITYGDHDPIVVNVKVTDSEVVNPDPEPVITLAVDKTDLSIVKGESATVKVTETTTIEDKATETDVTADAKYTVADDSIASVVAGVITAKKVGETTVTITHGDHNPIVVKINVTDSEVVNPDPKPESVITLAVDKTDLSVVKGESATVKVTETTTIEDKATETDVTADATYTVADDSIASVVAGVITAKTAGATTITVTHGEKSVTVSVKVTNPAPVDPGPVKPWPVDPSPVNPSPVNPGTVTPTPVVPDPIKPIPVDPVEPTLPTPVTFTDTAGHWAESLIAKASALGIFTGYSDGTFKPNNQLTRVQAVSMVVRTLDLQTDETAPFSDIANYADKTQAEIAAAYKYGIIKGNKGNFNPSDKVTRAQIALMIERAYEYKTGKKYKASKKAPFSDYGNYNAETVNAITMLSDLEIVSGFEGKFMANDPTTRAQAAKIFVNLMEKLQ